MLSKSENLIFLILSMQCSFSFNTIYLNRTNPTLLPCFHIPQLIAEQDALCRIKIKLSNRVLDHTWFRLAAMTRSCNLRMVWTIVKRIDMRSILRQSFIHITVKRSHFFFAIISACNTSLIGHYDDLISPVIPFTDKLRHTSNKLQIFRSMQIMNIYIDRTISIEESRFIDWSTFFHRFLCCGVILRNTDVDEISFALHSSHLYFCCFCFQNLILKRKLILRIIFKNRSIYQIDTAVNQAFIARLFLSKRLNPTVFNLNSSIARKFLHSLHGYNERCAFSLHCM